MKTKTYRRYLVVAVDYEIDCSKTDQNPDDHEEGISESVCSELDYQVSFDDKVKSGNSPEVDIEVPVRITSTEVIGFTNSRPLDC